MAVVSLASELPAVVIPTHRRRDLLVDAVASARPATVFVVDDSPRGLSPLPNTTWLRSQGSEGFARAANLGLAAAARAGHRVALVLNDDAALDRQCLVQLAQEWNQRGGIVGPVVRAPSGAVQSAGFRLWSWGRLVALRRVPPQVQQVDAVSGACLMVGTAWRFDPHYSHGMEDIELCRRVRRAGGGVWVVPQASCQHVGGATVSGQSAEAQRRAVAGHLRLMGGGLHTLPVVGLAWAQVVRERGPFSRFSAVVQGLGDHRRSPA